MMAADLSQCGDEGAPWLAVAGRGGVPKKRTRRKAEGGGENGQRRAGPMAALYARTRTGRAYRGRNTLAGAFRAEPEFPRRGRNTSPAAAP